MKNPGRWLTRAERPRARLASGSTPDRALATERDALHQTLHFLSNNIHSLSLRLFIASSANPNPELRTHLEAAQRLADESASLLERIHTLLPPSAPPPPPPERRRRNK